MVLPVNTQTAGEALSLASEASLRGSQSLAISLDSQQKMREMQEWSSEEQKKMRKAKAKAETATAEKQFNLDTLEGEFIAKNPELYQEAMKSGVMSDAAKKWQEMDAAESEMFGKLFANIDAEDPEQVKFAVTAGLTNPATRAMTSRLPSANALLKGDPSAIAQLKVLQGSWFMNAKHQQALALGEVDQGYKRENYGIEEGMRSRLSKQEFGQQSALSRQGFGQQSALQDDQQGFMGGVYSMQDATTRRGQDISLQSAQARAAASKDDATKQRKISDELGETTTNWKGKTLTNVVAGQIKAKLGVDEPDPELVKSIAAEAGEIAAADWNAAQRDGIKTESPNELAAKVIDYMLAAGRYKPASSWYGSDSVVPENKMGEATEMLKDVATDYGQEDIQPFVQIYEELWKDPEFRSMSVISQRRIMKRIFEGD